MVDIVNNTSNSITPQMDKKEREVAIQAQTEYDRGNCKECIQLLDSLSESKGRILNRALAQFSLDQDVDCLLNHLIATEDLEPNQQVLVDYNRALALARFKGDFDEAIDLLENRRAVLPESSGVIDDRLVIQLTLLLGILYLESKKDPQKAFNLFQVVSEKADPSLCPPDKIQQLKVKAYLQMGKTTIAKKELKTIAGVHPFLRCLVDYQKGNFKKASKTLETIPDEAESVVYRNNDALILFASGKRNTAAFKFNSMVDSSLTSLPVEAVYNLAVVQLLTGNCHHSRQLLSKLLPHFRFNPRLWLRFGETFLQEQSRNFLLDIDLNLHKQDIVNGFAGDGIHRKLLLKPHSSRSLNMESITIAKTCFLNGLQCFNSRNLSFFPSNVLSEKEVIRLKTALLLSLTYIHLTLDDVYLALSSARAALLLNPKGYQRALANLYAGESLLLLDRVSEAVIHFNPILATEDPSQQQPISSEEIVPPPEFISSWYPNTARVTLTYNLALTLTLRGEYDRAIETLRQIISNVTNETIVPIHVIMLAVYIQLQQGSIEGAKALIRQHLPHLR